MPAKSAYKASSIGQEYLKQIQNKGKHDSLVLPQYQPLLERPINLLIALLFLGAAPAGYFVHWLAGAGTLLGALILYSLRELFIQDDHALVRIYGPLGRLLPL